MPQYPNSELVPWKYESPSGPTYYKGLNAPTAVILHIAAGWESTIRDWATSGHYGASWHYTVCRDGRVLCHLALTDGGYQAGIARERRDAGGRVFGYNPEPTWPLWRGWGENVNAYSVGVEHEGVSGEPFTAAQAEASRKLCRWLATELGIPYDRDHFPPHADIALIDRPNDFNTAALREAHYQFMFEEEGDEMGMTTEERAYVDALRDAVYGQQWALGVLTKQQAEAGATIALMTRAPAAALAPDGQAWNLYVRTAGLLADLEKEVLAINGQVLLLADRLTAIEARP